MVLVHPKMDEVCRLHPALIVAVGEKHYQLGRAGCAAKKSVVHGTTAGSIHAYNILIMGSGFSD